MRAYRVQLLIVAAPTVQAIMHGVCALTAATATAERTSNLANMEGWCFFFGGKSGRSFRGIVKERWSRWDDFLGILYSVTRFQ